MMSVWEQYAKEIQARYPNGAGRSFMAELFGVDKTVATRHLEKGVERGLLRKTFTWVKDNSRGWVYFGIAQDGHESPPTDDAEDLPF